jgi:RNA polymerase sigma factor (sigma-70 family)
LSFFQDIPDASNTDGQLLTDYRQSGDLKYLGYLYSRYIELVYGVCLKYLSDSDAAKDATMQIFEELVDKAKKHTIDNFRGWLYTLAKNYCLMKLRSSKQKLVIPFDGSFMQSGVEEHPEAGMEKENQLQLLEACIEKLKAEQQLVIRMFYLQEKCYNDIVSQTSLDWNQVRSLVQNGRRNLKICMEKNESVREIPLDKLSKD